MKVQNQNPVLAVDPKKNQGKREDVAPTPEQAKQNLPAEKVTISRDAVNIQQVEKDIKSIPDVRMDVVNRIRAEVQSGNYNRPADKVADAMIASSLTESLYRE